MDGVDFEYLSYGPDKGAARSLVVLLHGYGRDATAMEKMALAVRDAVPGAVVLCPHGPEAMNNDVMQGGHHHLHIPQEALPENGSGEMRQWFRIDGQRDALMPRLAVIAARLNEFIDRERDRLGLQDRDVALMGFSQGAGTALYTAYTRATDIAGLVCHSSIVIEKEGGDQNLRSRPRTLFLYGDQDPEFPVERYRRSYDWVNRYTAGQAVERVVPGLGHYTNKDSRAICAEFIADVLQR